MKIEPKYALAVENIHREGRLYLFGSSAMLQMGLGVLTLVDDAKVPGTLLLLAGLGFGIAGLLNFRKASKAAKRIKGLVEQNRYVRAQITGWWFRTGAKSDNILPRYLIARYTDAAGRTRTFESDDTYCDNVVDLVGQTVRIYLGSNEDDYFMDFWELLGQ